MTHREKIKAVVERCISDYKHSQNRFNPDRCSWVDVVTKLEDTLEYISKFIDSLPEEPVKDLEEAAIESFKNDEAELLSFRDYHAGFKAGAQWMPLQLLKHSEPAEIGYWNQRGLSIMLDKNLEDLGFGENTKVKVIIIKEDEECRTERKSEKRLKDSSDT